MPTTNLPNNYILLNTALCTQIILSLYDVISFETALNLIRCNVVLSFCFAFLYNLNFMQLWNVDLMTLVLVLGVIRFSALQIR